MASIPTRPVTFGVTFPVTFPVSDPLQEFLSAASGYKLNDDGTNAAEFGAAFLPTISPARNRATYTLTATEQPLMALPAVIDAAPGLVTMTEGVPLVCGFICHSVPVSGAIEPFGITLYNIDGPDPVVAAVTFRNVVDGEGIVEGSFGVSDPGPIDFPTTYTGAVAGVKVAIQLTLSSGNLTMKLFINGSYCGESAPIATTGGVVALMTLTDGTGTGVIDISCVPDAASLATGYGAFDAAAVDMVGVQFDAQYLVDSVGDYLTDDVNDYLIG